MGWDEETRAGKARETPAHTDTDWHHTHTKHHAGQQQRTLKQEVYFFFSKEKRISILVSKRVVNDQVKQEGQTEEAREEGAWINLHTREKKDDEWTGWEREGAREGGSER